LHWTGGTDMKLNLLATTAAVALLASTGAWAQPQGSGPNEHKAQAHDQKAQAREQKGAGHESQAATQDRAGKQLQTKDTAAETGKPGAQHAEDAQQKSKSARDQMNARKDDAKTKDASKAAEWQDQKKPDTAAKNEDHKPGADQKSAADTKGKAAQDRMNKADATKAGKNDKKAQAKAAEQKGDQKADQAKQQAEKKDNTKANTAATDSKAGTTNNPASQAKNNNATQSQNKNAAQNNQPASQSAAKTSQSASQQTGERDKASTKLRETDKTKVFSTLKSSKQASNQNINVSVSVGERLPPRVHARPLPRTVVEVMPQYRGYDYVTVRDEVYIVRPGTREVVDVIQQPGSSSSSYASMTTHQGSSTTIHLTDQQKTRLRTEAKRFTTSQVSGAGSQCLALQPVPSFLANENPDMKKYQMLSIGDDIVLVDPAQKKVVDVIQ
jgi:hypothetical protein